MLKKEVQVQQQEKESTKKCQTSKRKSKKKSTIHHEINKNDNNRHQSRSRSSRRKRLSTTSGEISKTRESNVGCRTIQQKQQQNSDSFIMLPSFDSDSVFDKKKNNNSTIQDNNEDDDDTVLLRKNGKQVDEKSKAWRRQIETMKHTNPIIQNLLSPFSNNNVNHVYNTNYNNGYGYGNGYINNNMNNNGNGNGNGDGGGGNHNNNNNNNGSCNNNINCNYNCVNQNPNNALQQNPYDGFDPVPPGIFINSEGVVCSYVMEPMTTPPPLSPQQHQYHQQQQQQQQFCSPIKSVVEGHNSDHKLRGGWNNDNYYNHNDGQQQQQQQQQQLDNSNGQQHHQQQQHSSNKNKRSETKRDEVRYIRGVQAARSRTIDVNQYKNGVYWDGVKWRTTASLPKKAPPSLLKSLNQGDHSDAERPRFDNGVDGTGRGKDRRGGGGGGGGGGGATSKKRRKGRDLRRNLKNVGQGGGVNNRKSSSMLSSSSEAESDSVLSLTTLSSLSSPSRSSIKAPAPSRSPTKAPALPLLSTVSKQKKVVVSSITLQKQKRSTTSLVGRYIEKYFPDFSRTYIGRVTKRNDTSGDDYTVMYEDMGYEIMSIHEVLQYLVVSVFDVTNNCVNEKGERQEESLTEDHHHHDNDNDKVRERDNKIDVINDNSDNNDPLSFVGQIVKKPHPTDGCTLQGKVIEYHPNKDSPYLIEYDSDCWPASSSFNNDLLYMPRPIPETMTGKEVLNIIVGNGDVVENNIIGGTTATVGSNRSSRKMDDLDSSRTDQNR